ncbi:MAG TPA: hypothetical protein DCE23_00380 [Firmicutes bacterium]|nr:hypothetical protein [Bacillota bacterium]
MLIQIYIISLLFITGIFFGLLCVINGLKDPLRKKGTVIHTNCCSNCNNPWKWYELIPFISFFINRGECPYCHSNIPLSYSALELISGLLFSFSYMIYGFSYEMCIMIILTMLSIIIFVSDFKYYVILDKPLIISSILILSLKNIFFSFETLIISFISGFILFLFMMLIRFIGNKLFKEETIGGGDIKLAMVFGFTLGVKLSIISLTIGSFLAFPYAIYLSLSKKEHAIAFGPFLITGLYLTFIFMPYINEFISTIF